MSSRKRQIGKQPKLGSVKMRQHKNGFWLLEQEGSRNVPRERCNSEDAEQMTAYQWLLWRHPQVAELTFHVANETKANAFYGSKQKQMGKVSGVSDLICLRASGAYSAGCFEMKRVNPALYRPSAKQRDFLTAAHEDGKFACVCWGAEAFKAAMQFYLTCDE